MSIVEGNRVGEKILLLGHSAGGVVACLYALDHPDVLTGLISESFAFELPAPDFALAVFKGLGYITPHLKLLNLPNERFSRDPEAVMRMDDDPAVGAEKQPAEMMAALVRADERLRNEFANIVLPVLIVHGTADKNTKPEGSQFFYDNVGAQDKTLKFYEGGFHDLLNDTDKGQVLADILEWVNQRI